MPNNNHIPLAFSVALNITPEMNVGVYSSDLELWIGANHKPIAAHSSAESANQTTTSTTTTTTSTSTSTTTTEGDGDGDGDGDGGWC